MSRDINKFKKPALIPIFQQRCKEEAGHTVIITSVDRDYKEQYALWCQGREPLEVTNRFRKIAGLPPINQARNSKKVTWTLRSKHIINLDDERQDNDLSEAFDFCIIYKGEAIWEVKADVDNDKISDYRECALIGESLGLKSGMRFKNPDIVHLELP